jgi:hypothetical protein
MEKDDRIFLEDFVFNVTERHVVRLRENGLGAQKDKRRQIIQQKKLEREAKARKERAATANIT